MLANSYTWPGRSSNVNAVSDELAPNVTKALADPLAFVIPKANALAHVEANAAAGDLDLDSSEIAEIDAAYPVRERVGALPMN